MLTASERANIIRWDGQRRGWYEVWFCKFVMPDEHAAFWFRYTILVPDAGKGDPQSMLWGMFYDGRDPHRNLAIKEVYPLAHLQADRDRFQLQMEGAFLGHGRASGRLHKGARGIEWDLEFDPNDEPYYQLFPLLRKLEITKTRICTPNLDVRWRGRLVVNGHEYTVKDAPGQQSHIWGTKHAERWAWANCHLFSGDSTAMLEGFSAVIKLGPVVLRPLTPMLIRYRGQTYDMKGPLAIVRHRTEFSLGSWDFTAESGDLRFVGEVRAKLENLIGVEYKDPDGEPRYCYHDELADCRLKVYRRAGGEWRQEEELLAQGTCAGEWVTREKVAGVPIQIHD